MPDAPEPYRRSPNVPYVGDIDRYGYRVTAISTGRGTTVVLEGVHDYNRGQTCVVPISEAHA